MTLARRRDDRRPLLDRRHRRRRRGIGRGPPDGVRRVPRRWSNAYADDAVLAAVWADVDDTLDRRAARRGSSARCAQLGCSDVDEPDRRRHHPRPLGVPLRGRLQRARRDARPRDRSTQTRCSCVFLLLAPLGPLVAAAGAFGGWADPCHAVLRPLPTSTLRLTARPHRRRRRAGPGADGGGRCRGSPTAAGWRSGGCCPSLALAVGRARAVDVDRRRARRASSWAVRGSRCPSRCACRCTTCWTPSPGRSRSCRRSPPRSAPRSSSSHANRSSTTGRCDERARRDPRADQELRAVTGRSTGVDLDVGTGRRRPARPERRRQDDAAADPRHGAGADVGHGPHPRPRSRPTPRAGWRSGARSATCRRRSGCTRPSRCSTSSTTSRSSRSTSTARARHDEVRRVIDAVDLGDVRSKRIRKLSGGMRRRVALAQALLGDPAAARARRAHRRARPRAATAVPSDRVAARRAAMRDAVDPHDRGRRGAVRPGDRDGPRRDRVRRHAGRPRRDRRRPGVGRRPSPTRGRWCRGEPATAVTATSARHRPVPS